ncbi:hypothetical protein RTM1035_07478 [Roseovarius sp. TM1035]|nr:hypothetical protein RTM1035_07478 [Roseovarius sp. TM1035]
MSNKHHLFLGFGRLLNDGLHISAHQMQF